MRRILSGIALTAAFTIATIALAQEEPPGYSEAISVVRYLIDVRVTDDAGNALKGLSASDFEATIGGQAAVVEVASWVAVGQGSPAPSSADGTEPSSETASGGRLVVFFVSTDFARNAPRIKGHMAFDELFGDRIFGMLSEADRVAVLSFDSRLKLLRDFTSDHAAAREAVRRSLRIENVPLPEPLAAGPSLASHLDAESMSGATSGEEALLLVARALREIDGEKLLVMPSWGMGERTGGRVSLAPEWDEAVAILRRDHVPVISVATGSGGELTLGVAQTAHATGGVFASAISSFPAQSLTRIEGFLEGSYELVLRLERPLEVGEYEIVVKAQGRGRLVRAAPSLVVDQTDVLYGEAVSLFNTGEHDAAIAVLRQSIASEDIPTDVMVDRLRALAEARQWEATLVVAEELGRRGTVDGVVAEMIDEAKRGTDAGRRSDSMARLSEARRRLLDGSTEGVDALLGEAIALAPHLGEAWYERGMLRLSEGDTEDAVSDLRRYLELEPNGRYATDVRAALAVLQR